MTLSTLMVHLDLEQSNDARLRIATELSELFDAKLIGIAAATPQPTHYADGTYAQTLISRERARIEKRMAAVEERFRSAVRDHAPNVEWRSSIARPTEYISSEARAADLVVSSGADDGLVPDRLQHTDASELVLKVGRPLLLVPAEVEFLRLKRALIAWKDTREARRAVADAIPLLKKADDVAVVEVIGDGANREAAQSRVADVAHWLTRHGIMASGKVFEAVGEQNQLEEILAFGADLIVAGAYGHTRIRELVFGGFTRGLLTSSRHCCLLSH